MSDTWSNGTASDPLAYASPDNHTAYVVIATAMGISFVGVCGLIRVYMSQTAMKSFNWSEAALTVSMALALFQSIAVFLATGSGFGKSLALLDASHLLMVEKALYAADLLYIVILWASKSASILLFVQLSTGRNLRLANYATGAFCSVWGLGSFFAIALRCNIQMPWSIFETMCPKLFTMWEVVGIVDIFTELLLFALAIYLVYDLQMSIANKAAVVAAFMFRLLLIGGIIVRLYFINTYHASSDPASTWVNVQIWSQIIMNFSIIAATIPTLKPFMLAFNTDAGAVLPPSATSSARNTKFRRGSNYVMQSFGSSNLGQKSKIVSSVDARPRREDMKSSHIPREDKKDAHSIGSNDSMQMIIKKEVNFTVTSELKQPSSTAKNIGTGV